MKIEHMSLRELRESIPSWMTSRRVLFAGAAASVLIVGTCVTYGFVLSAKSDLHATEDHVEMQKILLPALANLNAQIVSTREAVYYADTGPWRSVPELLDRMRTMSFMSGLRNADFLPDPRSAAEGGLRISIFAEGSTESIRQFVLLVSGQSWCRGLQNPVVRSTGQWREFSATLDVGDGGTRNDDRGGSR